MKFFIFIAKHNIDLSSSYLIGDNLRDIEAGQAVNVKSFLLCEESSKKEHQINKISEALDQILK